jgi:hypothetical protein
MSKIEPRLRRVSKTKPLYPLNEFPASFVKNLAEHICAHLAINSDADLEGKDWEKIFADCINAKWAPSNVGLDDITHIASSTAWGAKTVKGKVLSANKIPAVIEKVRLISGRNSPNYSYGEAINPKKDNPNIVGGMVLDIWNSRVREVRAKFENLRTAVLIKGDGLLSVIVFEYDTDMYISEDFLWNWNKRGNLEGNTKSGEHKFTWQPHGSQFTIIEKLPENYLRLAIKKPKPITKEQILEQIGFDNSFFKGI